MLYEMVNGVRAFVGSSVADTLSAVVRAQPKPPDRTFGVPITWKCTVTVRCLRKDPERRFQHMVDVKWRCRRSRRTRKLVRVTV